MVFLNSVTIQAGKEQKYIPLTKGYSALVDPEDFERFSQYKWSTVIPYPGCIYACRVTRVNNKQRFIYLHREILGAPKGLHVDHANGDTLDNRRANLRQATPAQNAHNIRKSRVNTTGFRGVKPKHGKREIKYFGTVKANGRLHYTKHFASPILAAIARDALALSLHGEFAVLNLNN